MNIKEFKQRWLNSKIEPELFYMPVKKKASQPAGDALVIEVTVTENQNIYFGQYTPFGGTVYGSRIFQNYPADQSSAVKYPPIDRRPKILYPMYEGANNEGIGNLVNSRYFFDFCNIIRRITTEDGTEVTPDTNPDIFTDAPCNINLHPWEADLITKSWLISKNLYIQHDPYLIVDWGDGSIIEYAPYQYDNEKNEYNYNKINIELNGKKYIVHHVSTSGFYEKNNKHNTGVQHKYEQAGTYTVKVTGIHPYGITIPAATTKVISFGNLMYRDWSGLFNQIYRQDNPIVIENYPKKEVSEKIISLYNAFYQVNCQNIDFTFIKDMRSLVCLYYAFGNAKNLIVPDELFANMEWLSDACGCFNYAKIIPNNSTFGYRLFYNCPRLFAIENVFYGASCEEKMLNGFESSFEKCSSLYVASYILNSSLYAETIGKNMFKDCISLISCCYIFIDQYVENYNIKIGEGIFSNCPHLRNLGYAFYNNSVTIIPDNFLSDVQPDDEYITAPLSMVYMWYADSSSDAKELYLGHNMVTSYLQKGGKLIIGQGWMTREKKTWKQEGTVYITEKFQLLKGEAPPFWDYPDQVYIGSYSKSNTISQAIASIYEDDYGNLRWGSNINTISECFGFIPYTYSFTNNVGNTNITIGHENHLDNYGSIPKPNEKNEPPNNMWLYRYESNA